MALKLLQKPHISRVQQTNIIDIKSLFEGVGPLHSPTESKARVLLWINSTRFEDIGVYHASAAHLVPARLTERALGILDESGAVANVTAKIDFERRLSELKVKRPNAALGAGAVKLMSKIIQRAFKMLDIDALIHDEPFKLMEHLRVSNVLLSPITASDIDHTDGRLTFEALHFSHLTIGSMWREHHLTEFFVCWQVYKKRFPLITSRVISGHVERLERIIIPVRLWIAHPGKTDFLKNTRNLFDGLRDGVQVPLGRLDARSGQIDPGYCLCLVKLAKFGLQGCFELIEELSGSLAVSGCYVLDLLGQLIESAFFSQILGPQLLWIKFLVVAQLAVNRCNLLLQLTE